MSKLKPEKGLTEKERAIVALVAEGYSNLNIASLLDVSENTIKCHLYRVYDKTGHRSRTQVAVKFLKGELL